MYLKHLMTWLLSAEGLERLSNVRHDLVQHPTKLFNVKSSEERTSCTDIIIIISVAITIVIIITRPKRAYNRQSLTGGIVGPGYSSS